MLFEVLFAFLPPPHLTTLQVLEHLQSFEVMTAARPKPFASLKREDIRIINYNTTIFDPTDFPGAIRTDTEVCAVPVLV
jgi:hypothetical protein